MDLTITCAGLFPEACANQIIMAGLLACDVLSAFPSARRRIVTKEKDNHENITYSSGYCYGFKPYSLLSQADVVS